MNPSMTRGRGWRMSAMLIALAMTTTAAPAQTATAEGPSGTLTVAWPWDPGTMDPQMHRQRYTQIISHAMRDKLYFQPPPGLTLAPLQAESVTQVDETNYDVKIREGILFHNGEELTSEDVVYTFERLWDPDTASPRASMGNMANIAGVEAIDRYTVRWTTKVPFGPPEDAVGDFHFSGQEMLPKSVYENLTLEEAQTAPVVGSGPFKYVEWIPNQRVVMEAFDDYWQGAPGVERIIWRTIPEETTRVAELLAGSVDMIYPVTPDFVPQLRSAGMKLEIVPATSMNMLMMNVREGSPFADPEVRRAMNVAIDKQAIVDNIYQGLAVPALQVPGVGQEGFIEGYDPFSYDPDAARPILEKITKPIELFVLQQYSLAAEVVAEQLRGYGMTVSTVVLDTASHARINEDGAFDLMLAGAGYGNGDFIGAYYNNQFECARLETNRIRTGFCDEALDAKVAEFRLEMDPERKQRIMGEVVRLLTETHMPWVPLFIGAEVWGMQPYVEGFAGSSAGQMLNLHKVTLN
jgi:peptide/nickel transport system substrate-binding protein